MRRIPLFVAILALMAGAVAGMAVAVEPDEMLADPALEERAREISKDLRCVVCQNQSIDDSNADIARDLRLLVRERLVAGDTDEQVVAYIVARYGDYVLLDPPFQVNTLALWLGPPIISFATVTVGVMLFRNFQRRAASRGPPEPLTAYDRAALDELVREVSANAPPPKPMSAFREELNHPFADDEEEDAETPPDETPPGKDGGPHKV